MKPKRMSSKSAARLALKLQRGKIHVRFPLDPSSDDMPHLVGLELDPPSTKARAAAYHAAVDDILVQMGLVNQHLSKAVRLITAEALLKADKEVSCLVEEDGVSSPPIASAIAHAACLRLPSKMKLLAKKILKSTCVEVFEEVRRKDAEVWCLPL